MARHTFGLVKQNIGIVGVPNLSALVVGTFLPISPIAAVFLNNGSCLVAAGNAIRALGFKAKPLSSASSFESGETVDVDTSESNTLDQQTLDLSGLAKRVGMSYQKISARRRRSDFATWISKHDPDGHAWHYCSDRNSFSVVAA